MGTDLKFWSLVEVFESLAQPSTKATKGSALSRKEKEAKLAELMFERYRAGPHQEASLYPLARLLCPRLDSKGRAMYQLKEKGLADLFIKAMGISNHSEEGKRMINFTQLGGTNKGQGNFSDVVYNVFVSRAGSCAAEGKHRSIAHVNDMLDRLAEAASSGGAARGKSEEIKQRAALQGEVINKDSLRQYSSKEWKWIIRIILREMKCVTEDMTLQAMHPDAKSFYSHHNNDLERACSVLKTGIRYEVGIELMHNFKSQSCARPSKIPYSLYDAGFPEKPRDGHFFYAELKMDGERLQIHKNGDEFKLFSRSGKDYTEEYMEPFTVIKKEGLIKADKCILDAEICVWQPPDPGKGNTEGYFDHPSNIKTTGIEGRTRLEGGADAPDRDERKRHLCIVVFDILLHEEEHLFQWDLKRRIEKLTEVCTWRPQLFESVVRQKATMVNDAFEIMFNLKAEEEGVVLKLADSKYKPGDRTDAWMKLKPDYLTGGSETFDCVIIGGNYGKGKRSGLITQYIVAVIDDFPKGGKPTVFRSFTKVGTGLSFAEQKDMAKFLESKERCVACDKMKKEQPVAGMPDQVYKIKWPGGETCYFSSKKPQGVIDVFIDPSKSKIVEIVADRRMIQTLVYVAGIPPEGTPADLKPSALNGWSLRFPRITDKGVRDKSLGEALCQKELWEAIAFSMTASDSAQLQDTLVQHARRKGGGGKRKREVLGMSSLSARADVVKMCDAFKDHEVCILNGRESDDYQALENYALSLGATLTKTPAPSTSYIIALCQDICYQTQVELDRDVIMKEWLEECFSAEKILELHPKKMWHVSQETKNYFESRFDEFGDSYTASISKYDAGQMLKTSNDGDEESDFLGLSDSDVEGEEEMKEVEGLLSLSKVQVGAKVKARIEVEGHDGPSWRDCTVQERDEIQDLVVLTCEETGSNRKRRHQVAVSSDEILLSEAQKPPEWSSFAGMCVLLLPLSSDHGAHKTQLQGGHASDDGSSGLFGLGLKMAMAHIINGGGQAVMGIPNLRMQEQRQGRGLPLTHIVLDRHDLYGANSDFSEKEKSAREAEIEEMLRKEALRTGGYGVAFVVDVSWVFDMSRGFAKARRGIDLLMEKNKHYLIFSH